VGYQRKQLTELSPCILHEEIFVPEHNFSVSFTLYRDARTFKTC